MRVVKAAEFVIVRYMSHRELTQNWRETQNPWNPAATTCDAGWVIRGFPQLWQDWGGGGDCGGLGLVLGGSYNHFVGFFWNGFVFPLQGGCFQAGAKIASSWSPDSKICATQNPNLNIGSIGICPFYFSACPLRGRSLSGGVGAWGCT